MLAFYTAREAGMANQSKAVGGKARAEKLSPERRKEIARKAAESRWEKASGLPKALFGSGETPLMVGGIPVDCYVLDDGRRVLTQESFLVAMGRAAKAKGGHGVRTSVDKTPPFLAASNLKPLIEKEISGSTDPIEFVTTKGVRILGFPAELLPQICRIYLAARDEGILHPRQRHIAERADILVRALASVGIAALVDEATGYQEVRDRQALSALLDQYINQELAAWAKRFPDEFYRQMFRLRGWQYPTASGARPGIVGRYTTDIVYDRLAPGIVNELEKLNPKNDRGNRRAKHHQFLTDEVGHPALAQHLHAVITLMRASSSWEQFKHLLDLSLPRKGDSLQLELT
ncbi:P63C domain-containing protein [Halomonas sp. BBD48]|nr:P63C domain-containing protein [Halomonas sp. BBD48]